MSFTVSSDITKPAFESLTTTANSDPFTSDKRATSTTNIVLTTSEAVSAFNTSKPLTMTSALGQPVTLMFSDATIYQYVHSSGTAKTMFYFSLPTGVNFTEN